MIKNILIITLSLFLCSCNKDDTESIISKDVLSGEYLGVTNETLYNTYTIYSSDSNKVILEDNSQYVPSDDSRWIIRIINNQLVISDQFDKWNIWDNEINKVLTYYNHYTGSGQLLRNPAGIKFEIFKNVFLEDQIISRDTLNIELVKPADISQFLTGTYENASSETIQVEKVNTNDSLIIKIRKSDILPQLREFKIKQPDLTNQNSAFQLIDNNVIYHVYVTFGKDNLKLDIYRCTPGCNDYYIFNGMKK
jgi:hypothetical protein